MQVYPRPKAAKVMTLLAACSLPNADISDKMLQHFFGCGPEANPSGVVGVELHGEVGLLRSLAVLESARGKGCGKRLVQEAEDHARRSGVKQLYLLTTTAERFFASLGYTNVNRDSAPEAIRGTTEFTTLCASSATLMTKKI